MLLLDYELYFGFLIAFFFLQCRTLKRSDSIKSSHREKTPSNTIYLQIYSKNMNTKVFKGYVKIQYFLEHETLMWVGITCKKIPL